jgi:hypothetical protein
MWSSALEGNPDRLKERTIGVDVFGRPADYDTASDHAVRSAMAEVRKRLAQYYQDGDDSDLRIEIQPGSYIPQFRLAGSQTALVVPEPEAVEPPSAAPLVRNRWNRPVIATVAVACLASILVVIPRWAQSADPVTVFWALSSHRPQRSFCAWGTWKAAGRRIRPASPSLSPSR